MEAERLFKIIGSDFYTGVPDSQLKPLCDFLISYYGTDPLHHIIATNEGNCAGIAAGYHFALVKYQQFICRTVGREISLTHLHLY